MTDNSNPWNILMHYIGIRQPPVSAANSAFFAQNGMGFGLGSNGQVPAAAANPYSPYGLATPAVVAPTPGRVPAPSDKELGFDPNGPGQWDIAMAHPVDAYKANALSNQAIAETTKQYPNDRNPHDDEADAFRHAYWSYLITKALGADRAKQIGDGHEITKPDPGGERAMDLYNNGAGRTLSQAGGDGDAVAAIQNAIKSGSLRLKPY